MNRHILFSFLLVTLALSQPTFAQQSFKEVSPNPKSLKAWQAFKAEHGEGWEVFWNKFNGYPEVITGEPTFPKGLNAGKKNDLMTRKTGITQKEAEELSRLFLQENSELLGINVNDLKLVKVKKPRLNTMVAFQQIEQGIPVYDSYIKCFLNEKGQIISVDLRYHPDITVNTKPRIDLKQAIASAMQSLPSTVDNKFIETQKADDYLLVLPKDNSIKAQDKDSLAWIFILNSKKQLYATIFAVDAETGNILFSKSLIIKE